MGSNQRIRRSAVLGLTLTYLVVTALGLWMGRFERDAWSGALMELASAVGLVAIGVMLERWVVKQVNETTQTIVTETVERETAEIKKRLVKLEDLDEAQAFAAESLRSETSAALAELAEQDLTPGKLGKVLSIAMRERLLDSQQFRVRCGDSEALPLMSFLSLQDSTGFVPCVWIDFQPFEFGSPLQLDGQSVPAPAKTDSIVMWTDEDAGTIGAQLGAGLRRRRLPHDGFSFRFALKQLIESVTIAETARSESSGSPGWLTGQMRVKLNDEWVWTSAGLEAVNRKTLFPIEMTSPEALKQIVTVGEYASVFIRFDGPEAEQPDAALQQALRLLKRHLKVKPR